MLKNKNIQFIIFVVLFTIFLDFILGSLYEKFYFSEKSKKNDRLIHSVIGTKEDVLIFGSSRALHHYNPKIIEDSLGMTCYNVRSGGQNIYFHLALLKSALERYTPKIILLELMSIDFEKTPPQWDTEKLGVLLPFSNKSEAARQAVMLRGTGENIKLLSQSYPFNSTLYYILRNNFNPFNNNINGFIPIQQTWAKPIEKMKEKAEKEEDIGKLNALYSFIEKCQQKKIKLFVFVSPHFVINEGDSKYKMITNQLKNKYGINVINFEKDTIFLKHPEYFADQLHLNYKGANIFTSFVVKKLN